MDAIEVLDRLHDLGVTVQVNGPKVRLEPASKVPADLLAAVRQNKADIIKELQQSYGDGQPAPQDRAPADDRELRRLMDDTADPERLLVWKKRWDKMFAATDPAEAQK